MQLRTAGLGGDTHKGFRQYKGYQHGEEARVAEAWKVATGEDLFVGSVHLREFPRHVFYQREWYTGEWVHFSKGGRGVSADGSCRLFAREPGRDGEGPGAVRGEPAADGGEPVDEAPEGGEDVRHDMGPVGADPVV